MNTLVSYEMSIRYVGDRISPNLLRVQTHLKTLLHLFGPRLSLSLSLSRAVSLHCPLKYSVFCALAELTLFITCFSSRIK